jgi:hypothetical protein
MNDRRICVILLLLFLTCFSCSYMPPSNTTDSGIAHSPAIQSIVEPADIPVPVPAAPPQTDEEAVYAVLFAGGHLIELDAKSYSAAYRMWNDFTAYTREEFPGISDETITNYMLCNNSSTPLPTGMRIGVSYVVISGKKDMDQILKKSKTRFISDDEEGLLVEKGNAQSLTAEEHKKLRDKFNASWIALCEVYPGLDSCNSVSRVGFNNARSQALVCQAISYGGLNAWKQFVFLKKFGWDWIIDKTAVFMIS